MPVSRRAILKLGAASAIGTAVAADPAIAAVPVRAMRPARYAEVELHDGPMREQFRAQHATLMAMDEDALLKPFRQAAGMPAPGPDLGGWYNASPDFHPPENMTGYIPGHCFGQYVSSLARAHAVTGDIATREKVHRLVAGFAPTITPAFYDGYPLPAYTFDKINIGLIDALAFAHEPLALPALDRATDAALPHLPERALTREELQARPHPNVAFEWDESYTLPENLYLAWTRGAGERYRMLARRYLLDRAYFDPLARGENVLPGQHAYSHVNALNSAMEAFLVDASAKHLTAARNGFDFVAAQSFATGGWGPNEGFVASGSGGLGASLETTHASFETPCGAYGHFKIARHLLCATGDSRYGDSMEQVLYNTVLGALPMKPDGTAFYYSDYNSAGAKVYHEHKCTCCSGTLGQVTADYGISSYFVGRDTVLINLYTPSRLRTSLGRRLVTVTQTTAYPLGGGIEIRIGTPTAQTFAVALRVPAWAGPGTTLSVNGKRQDGVRPGTFHVIRRAWSDGDRIALTLDMPTRLAPVDDLHPDRAAVLHGPLALFATGDGIPSFRRDELLAIRQSAEGGDEWHVAAAGGARTFKPFYRIGGERTRLYQWLAA